MKLHNQFLLPCVLVVKNLLFLSFFQVAETTVQLLKKPGRAFGALLGNSASKKKIDLKKVCCVDDIVN